MRMPIIDQRIEAIVGVPAVIKGFNFAMNEQVGIAHAGAGKSVLHVAAWVCNGNLTSQYFRIGGFGGSGSYLALLEATSLTANQIRVRFQNETGAQQNSLLVPTGRETGVHSAVWYLNATQTQAYLWVDSLANYSTAVVNPGTTNQLALTNAYISNNGQTVGTRDEFLRVSGGIFTSVTKPSDATVTRLLRWARGTVKQ